MWPNLQMEQTGLKLPRLSYLKITTTNGALCIQQAVAVVALL